MAGFTRRQIVGGAAWLGAARLLPGCAAKGPSRGEGQARQVVVIGAGLAGLAAARRLGDGGRTVVVLEGRDRVGGRVWTDRSLGIPLDMGASWIHGVQGNPVAELASGAGLSTVRVDYESTSRRDVDGRELGDADDAAVEARFDALMAAVDGLREGRDADASLASAIGQVRGRVASGADQQRWLDHAVNSTIEHEYAASVENLSLLHWDAGRAETAGGDVIFPGGYDQLLVPLAAGLDVRLSHRVTRVEHGAAGCTVTTERGAFACEKVLVTLPLGVLKAGAVGFAPALPARKQQAIARLGSDVLDKLYLVFDRVFWGSAHIIGRADATRGRWAEFLNLHALLGQPALLGFNAAAYARSLEARPDAEVVADAMAALRQAYGAGIPAPKAFLRTRWGADPFALGSYSHLAVGASLDDRDALAAPVEGRLYFAGEATSRDHAATTHGALLSGRAAADALMA
jgi:monoamine oxidase